MTIETAEQKAQINSRVDVLTLQRLAKQLLQDSGQGLAPEDVREVCKIINTAIGAPLMTDIRSDAAKVADVLFPGDNQARHAFNWGVAWTVSRLANCRNFRLRGAMTMAFEIRTVREGLKGGGWHTVRRVFLPPPGARLLVCPACGNADPYKFKTVAPSNTLEGFLCMACTFHD